MSFHVAQIQKPLDIEKRITQPYFAIVGGPVFTVLEARDIVDNLVSQGGNESWFIIMETYPTRNQVYPK